jgi:hypothetical protein
MLLKEGRMDHNHWWKVLQLIVVLSLSVSLSACSTPFDVLQNAIDELGLQPAKWEETLKGAIDEFGIVSIGVAHQIKSELESLMRQTIQTAQEASFCEADYIGARVQQLLQGIMYKHFPNRSTPPSYTPVICTVDPPIVQSNSPGQVQFSGFDFYQFRNSGDFTADLYLNGDLSRERFGRISVETNYRLILDIQGANFSGISGSSTPQIILRWKSNDASNPSANQAEGKSEVPINIVSEKPPVFTQECRWTSYVSEENPPVNCASGYAVRGIACTGEYCDNMSLWCCSYMIGPDNIVTDGWTGYFSEERHDYTYTPTGSFVYGLACNHDYCDNINLQYLFSNSLRYAGQCSTVGPVSEENPNHIECGNDEFVAGMYCTGDYCDNVSLYCCKANYP